MSGVQFQGDISSDRTVLAPATALPWIKEAVLAENASSRPGQTGVRRFAVAMLCLNDLCSLMSLLARSSRGICRSMDFGWRCGRGSMSQRMVARSDIIATPACDCTSLLLQTFGWLLTRLYRMPYCCREKKPCWSQCKKSLTSACTIHSDAKRR